MSTAPRPAGRGAAAGSTRWCCRYAVRINGLDTVALTKLDVLDKCETVRVCIGYRYRGDFITEFPEEQLALAALEPVYEDIEGWMSPTAGAKNEADLPAKARRYLERLEELIGASLLPGVDRRRSATRRSCARTRRCSAGIPRFVRASSSS